jgi:DNA invertase Pin-like site-specific DNA recombinase
LEWFKERKIRQMILDLPTSLIEVPEGQEWILDMITNILVEVLSSMAEQERLTIKRRQREGIEAAKAKGKHLGRPRAVMPEHFPRIHDEWRRGKITTKQAMEILELKPTTFYRLVKRYESK